MSWRTPKPSVEQVIHWGFVTTSNTFHTLYIVIWSIVNVKQNCDWSIFIFHHCYWWPFCPIMSTLETAKHPIFWILVHEMTILLTFLSIPILSVIFTYIHSKHINLNKTPRPERLTRWLLKTWYRLLSGMLCEHFKRSLQKYGNPQSFVLYPRRTIQPSGTNFSCDELLWETTPQSQWLDKPTLVYF